MKTITNSDIEHILQEWLIGELNESQVHEWAEDRYWPGSYEVETDAANAVMSELDKMNMNLLIVDDVPKLIEALHSVDFEAILRNYFDKIDIEERRQMLRRVPLYSPFCQG